MSIKELVLRNVTKLPNSVNRVLLKLNNFPSIIYGKNYVRYINKMISNNFVNVTVDEKLVNLVNHAIKNVPYYKNLYAIEAVNSVAMFVRVFGFIDKDLVMRNLNVFVQQDIDKQKYTTGTTGGTSGKPLQLLMPNNRYIVELGTIHALWSKFDFDYSARAVLRNHKIQDKYEINPVTKEYIFNGFDLTDKNFEIIYKVMKKNNIQFLQCYPSSGYEFAHYLKKNNLDVSFIKAFFVSSENVLSYQRALVKSLNINYFSLYGHSEKLVMAANCPYSDYYHIVPSYGYFELIDENEKIITTEGVIGEIVGSTINNYGFPLIRYKTGDFAEYINTECACGYKGYSLKTIYGRWNGDKIYNHDDSFVTTTALNLHNDLYSIIEGLQYIQSKNGHLSINIIAGDAFTDKHEDRIYEHYKSKFNGDMVVNVCRVKSLVRQSNGKFLLLISTVSQ